MKKHKENYHRLVGIYGPFNSAQMISHLIESTTPIFNFQVKFL